MLVVHCNRIQQQALWFPGSRPEDLTQRDVERWLAWSLYGGELEEIEEERVRAKETPNNSQALPAAHHSRSALAEGRSKSQLSTLKMEEIHRPESPVPAPQSTFKKRQAGDDASATDSSEEEEGTKKVRNGAVEEDYASEDRRGARAKPGEWDADPVRGDRLEFLYYCRELIEARQGFTFPEAKPGWTPRPCMRLTIDPVVVTARPLALYAAVNLVSQWTIWSAKRHGFEKEQEGRMKYLIRRPDGWSAHLAKRDKRYRPIIFLHGLGIGLGQYAQLVHHLADSHLGQTHPILVPLQPHISQAIFDPSNHLRPMIHHEFTALLRRIFRREHWLKCGVTVLSHSNGTMVHSWLLKSAGDVVRRSCFVDPVCFQLWVPHIIGQFLYRKPATAVMVGVAHLLCHMRSCVGK